MMMHGLRRLLLRKRTPDEELAKAVRQAAKDYNEAVRRAAYAGLNVHAYGEPYFPLGGSVSLGGRTIGDIQIVRDCSRRL